MRYWDGAAWTSHFADTSQTDARSEPEVVRQSVYPQPQSGPHEAPPHGRPIAPWSEHLRPQPVVGESFHDAAFEALAISYGYGSVPAYGVELHRVPRGSGP